jgi:alpha-L-fucosidase 2
MRLNHSSSVAVYFTIAMGALTAIAVSPSGAERGISGLAMGPTSPLMLWYPKPADSWTDGVAIGNGRLGAMVFGQPG